MEKKDIRTIINQWGFVCALACVGTFVGGVWIEKCGFAIFFFSLSSSIHRRLFISSFIAIETKLHMKIKKNLLSLGKKEKEKREKLWMDRRKIVKVFCAKGWSSLLKSKMNVIKIIWKIPLLELIVGC